MFECINTNPPTIALEIQNNNRINFLDILSKTSVKQLTFLYIVPVWRTYRFRVFNFSNSATVILKLTARISRIFSTYLRFRTRISRDVLFTRNAVLLINTIRSRASFAQAWKILITPMTLYWGFTSSLRLHAQTTNRIQFEVSDTAYP